MPNAIEQSPIKCRGSTRIYLSKLLYGPRLAVIKFNIVAIFISLLVIRLSSASGLVTTARTTEFERMTEGIEI